MVSISSAPDAAEIYVDGKFHGNTLATLRLSAGSHEVALKSAGRSNDTSTLEIPKSSKLSLKAVFGLPTNGTIGHARVIAPDFPVC